jgi:hypothetical protein
VPKASRQIASDKTAFEIRNQLLSLAEDYERLAAMLEDIDATNIAIEGATISFRPRRT